MTVPGLDNGDSLQGKKDDKSTDIPKTPKPLGEIWYRERWGRNKDEK